MDLLQCGPQSQAGATKFIVAVIQVEASPVWLPDSSFRSTECYKQPHMVAVI